MLAANAMRAELELAKKRSIRHRLKITSVSGSSKHKAVHPRLDALRASTGENSDGLSAKYSDSSNDESIIELESLVEALRRAIVAVSISNESNPLKVGTAILRFSTPRH